MQENILFKSFSCYKSDKRCVKFIYYNYILLNMILEKTYSLPCVCGHDFIKHIGETEGFQCNLQKNGCSCIFYHPKELQKSSTFRR
jgi:hypothetical protein